MRIELEGDFFVIYLGEKISADNAASVEKKIADALKNFGADKKIVLDVHELEYISSAGVRIVLKLAKKFHDLKIRDAAPEIYSVLDMTGLTKIIPVTRALREISIDGAEVIGSGYAGTIYRLNDDLILKLYNAGMNRDFVDREKNHAEKAFLNGISTAISYDVVKHGEQFGIVFEMMNAKNLAEVFAAEPQNFDEIIGREADFLRQLHRTSFDEGTLPAMKDNYKLHLSRTTDFLTRDEILALTKILDALPDRNTFLHGDFHPRNIMVSNGEFMLIDMTDVALGHPIFDLTCVLFSCRYSTWGNPENLPQIIGFDVSTAEKYLSAFFRHYFASESAEFIEQVMNLSEKLSWLRRLVALPYLPRPVAENEVAAARKNFFPVTENFLTNYRELLDAI